MDETYKGKSRFLIGFAVGLIVTLLYLTFTTEPGFYPVWSLSKYSFFGGLAAGFINFVLYEFSYISPEDIAKEKAKNVGSHSSPSYDNYMESSGGGGGDSGGGE